MSVLGLYEVLRAPISTEKTAKMEEHGEYAFVVALTASKADIKKAVEHIFSVQVARVRTVYLKGKAKRSGRRMGMRSDQKKAYVRLASGQLLNIHEG